MDEFRVTKAKNDYIVITGPTHKDPGGVEIAVNFGQVVKAARDYFGEVIVKGPRDKGDAEAPATEVVTK